ncbi:MAG: AEC family transporter [Candidatus Promineifilaceae bacterium]|nr:AEC family transporter [Candidatus Promineifilaceae bacterium]
MAGIADVLLQNILPIFLVAALGFWLQRTQKLDRRSLASVVFNGFSPALVFVSLVNSELALSELGRLAVFTVLFIFAMGLLALLTGRLLQLPRAEIIVLLLTVMFVNGGNFGLTLNQLRYGEVGLARAIVYYSVSTSLVYTVGVFLASMGEKSWRESLRRLTRVPAIYAVILAIIFYSSDWSLPGPLMRGLEVAAAGAIPLMLVVLGMNLAAFSPGAGLRPAVPATVLRLLVGPVVAFALAALLGLQGLSRATAIVEASMPTAVITTVIATEFDVQPVQVTGIVVLSTLLSPLTLSFFINLFGL